MRCPSDSDLLGQLNIAAAAGAAVNVGCMRAPGQLDKARFAHCKLPTLMWVCAGRNQKWPRLAFGSQFRITKLCSAHREFNPSLIGGNRFVLEPACRQCKYALRGLWGSPKAATSPLENKHKTHTSIGAPIRGLAAKPARR